MQDITLQELEDKYNELRDWFYNHTHRRYDQSSTLVLTEGNITLSDITTDDVSTTKHGFAPKAPNDTLKYLRGDATWFSPYMYSFTAYENISANDPVRIAFGDINYLSQTSTAFVDAQVDGTGGNSKAQYSKFTISSGGAYVTQLSTYCKRSGSPADNLVLSIVNDSAGVPNPASSVASGSTSAAGISTVVGIITIVLASPVVLTAGDYWVGATRSGARDTTNRIDIANDGASANASNKQDNNGSFVNQSNLSFVVTRVDGTSGQVVKTNSSIPSLTICIGFSIGAITAGNTGLIQVSYIMSGFSSLSVGSKYYLTDAGGVSTTAGTVSRQLGIATSATQLLIQII